MLGAGVVPGAQSGPPAGLQGGDDRAVPAWLEHHGVDTTGWWDRQLGLCLVGIMATFAWEKAVGDEDELAWWTSAALAGARWLE